MQLIGQTVNHILFGTGTIAAQEEGTVTVRFPNGEKRFVYPDAFAKFLTLTDAARQAAVESRCDRIEEARQKTRRRHRRKQEIIDRLCAVPRSPKSQAVFSLDPEAIEKAVETHTVSAGCYLSGRSEGLPRIPAKLKANSACILTYIPAGGSEKDRLVGGMFMVDAEYSGSRATDGLVAGHHRFCYRIPTDREPRFWSLVSHNDPIPRFGRTTFRYFPNEDIQNVIACASRTAQGTGDESLLREFLTYYTLLNHLLPEPKAPAAD